MATSIVFTPGSSDDEARKQIQEQKPQFVIGGPPDEKVCDCCHRDVDKLHKNYRGDPEHGCVGSSWECIWCIQFDEETYNKVKEISFGTRQAIKGLHIIRYKEGIGHQCTRCEQAFPDIKTLGDLWKARDKDCPKGKLLETLAKAEEEYRKWAKENPIDFNQN